MLLAKWIRWHNDHLKAPISEWNTHTYIYLGDGPLRNEDIHYMQNHSSIVKLIGEHGSLSLNRICHQHALAQPILSPMIYLAPIAPPAVITTLPHYDGHGGNAAFHMAVFVPPGSHNRVTIWPSSHNNPRIDDLNNITLLTQHQQHRHSHHDTTLIPTILNMIHSNVLHYNNNWREQHIMLQQVNVY